MPKIDNKEEFGRQIPSIEELVFFGGRLNDRFGHFLLESLSRLWAYEAFRQFDPYIFFYTPRGMPDYLENFLRDGFGLKWVYEPQTSRSKKKHK
ncbi:hypothetical protein QUA82_24090 [Microcoleus sp. F8-D3]